MSTELQASPEAATQLLEAIAAGSSPFAEAADELMGATDCPEGCEVEPDGHCRHGWRPAARTARIP